MLTKTAISANEIKVGDDVLPMTSGRMTVASVEVVEHNRIRVTSTLGRTLVVSPNQLFARFEKKGH